MVEVIILAVLIGIVFFMMKRKKSEKKIHTIYHSQYGEFKVDGHTDRFIIDKDGRYEFLVENGVITACKDKQRHNKFIYYGVEKNV